MTFEKLTLHPSILKAISESGYTVPTPIQAQAIPQALEGHDLMASAQTGTGKTAAFVMPSLQRLSTPSTKNSRGPRVLVLTPTRELANQVTAAAIKYGKHMRFRIGSVVGGMPYPPQMRLLSQPLDILVATPGRLLDHMERGRIDYSRLEVLVLDEADRMLDMGFIHAVEKIAAATPAARQTLLFSATLEGNIAKLAARLLKNPKRIQIASAQERHEHIEQRLHHVDDGAHKHRLLTHLLDDINMDKAIVFTATKRGADRLAKTLYAKGHPAAALHGDMNQNQRNRAITNLRSGTVRLLVATDVAARGIDVSGITHVINFDLPKSAEDYVHRIGRTGRAGAKGIAISFAAPDNFQQLRDIERYTRQTIPAHVIPGLEPTIRPRQQAPSGHRRGGPSSHHPRRPDGAPRHFKGKNGGNHPRHGQGQRHGSGGTGRGAKAYG
ncbi:MAG: DEAD/DEAH box helicase [Gammaproteobacteria bacterium]|nr:DEAD/DEAH box helicase [Gammaproteobacteria bacterium]